MDISLTDVVIPADELTLAGHLRLPTEATSPGPAIVLTGPLTGVKEQVVGHYAARLAERGFATLAFGHRNFGASEGHRRQHEDSAGKLDDLRAATSFWRTIPQSTPNASAVWACAWAAGTH